MRTGRVVIGAWAFAMAVTFASTAAAHAVGLSRGEYSVVANTVTARLTFARADVEGLGAPAMLGGVVVTSHAEPCEGAVEGSETVEPDGIAWQLRFVCPRGPGPLDVSLPILKELPEGHRHAAHVQAFDERPPEPAVVDDVLYVRHDTITVVRAASLDARVEAPRPTWMANVRAMVRMGIEHILTGHDHLLFLFGLVLVGGRCRSLLAVVTAFTLAHSVTLAAAVLGVWAPPARIVESAIALSIAYVGVENFFVRSAEGRWRLTFAFGLVHGFGFASALRAVDIPRYQVAPALLSFNVGVELGQLAVLAALLPALALLRRSTRFATAGVQALSGATFALGAFWFVARALS